MSNRRGVLFGHRVHSRRDDRDRERQVARQPGRGRDVVGQDVRLGRDEQDVVEGQALSGELVLEREEPLDASDFDLRQLADLRYHRGLTPLSARPRPRPARRPPPRGRAASPRAARTGRSRRRVVEAAPAATARRSASSGGTFSSRRGDERGAGARSRRRPARRRRPAGASTRKRIGRPRSFSRRRCA